MSIEEFKSSRPDNLSVELLALWHDGHGDWDKSHETIQDVNSKNAAWIHAYLHRKEGDLGNAQYWYSRAGKNMPSVSLDEEWKSLVKHFLE
ncbi:MAG TPA: hypothetical protein VFE50_17090 [Cyclobacteriaceae bacterium]|nr:hypothetical protein [Cyclobacteriaceae bacterium]